MKAIVCGGGTGGHIYPALSIADRLRQDGADILYMGAHDSTEEKLSKERGFTFRGVDACGLHKKSLRLFADLLVNYRGLHQAKRIISTFAPDVVIGTGGYATAAVVRSAQKLHIPTVLHEQNAFPGLSNRMLARHADAVCLTFSEAEAYLPAHTKVHTTGLPIRNEILTVDKHAARRYFSIPEEDDRFTVLITGGSLGAASLNQAALAAYQPLLEQNIRIIHLCGKNNYFAFQQQAPKHPQLILKPYLDEMQYALVLADLAVSRSGASFLAEAACLGLPTIQIPYPYAANDHQRYNARAFVRAGAGLMIEDAALNGVELAQQVIDLANAPLKLQEMSVAARTLAHEDAAGRIQQIIYGLLA